MPVTQPVASQDQFSDIEKQLKSSQQELDTKLAPIQAEKSQAEQNLMGELSKPLPTPPQTQPIQQFQPRQVSSQEAMNFAGIATAFAALASLKTREPFAAALNAAGDAMKGFQQGNLAQAKIDIENFNTKTRAAIEENQRLMDQYNAVLNNRKLSIGQKQSMLGVIAAKEQDAIALDSLKTGQMMNFYKLADSRQRAQEALQLHRDQMAQNLQIQRERLDLARQKQGLQQGAAAGADVGLSPYDLNLAGVNYLFTGQLPFLGFGGQGGNARIAIMHAAGEAAKQMGMTPEEAASAKFNVKAQQQALNFMTKWGAGVQKGEDVVIRNGEIMMEYAKRLGLTDIQHLNKLIVAGQKEFGSPDAQAYANAAITVINEYARVMAGPMSNAMLHMGAMERANDALSQSMSVDQLEAALGIMEREMANQTRSVNSTIDGLRERMGHLDQGKKPAFDLPSRDTGKPASKYQEGQTATGPNGQKLVFRNGKWQPM